LALCHFGWNIACPLELTKRHPDYVLSTIGHNKFSKILSVDYFFLGFIFIDKSFWQLHLPF